MNNHPDIEMSDFGGELKGVVSQLHTDIDDSNQTNGTNCNLSPQPTNSLYCSASSNLSLRNFLIVTGNYWPQNNIHSLVSVFARMNFIVSKLAVLGCSALLLALTAILCAFISINNDLSLSYLVFSVALLFVLSLSTISVLPAQYFNGLRLKMTAGNEDILAVGNCLPLSYMYGIVSFVCVCVGIGLESEVVSVFYLTAAVASSFVVLALMFNLFFLLLDLKVSIILLDQLHSLADSRMLTMEKFNFVRAEIDRRVAASRLACDFILLPSIASIVGIVLSVIIIDRNVQCHTSDDFRDDGYGCMVGIEHYVGLVFIQLKELFYVAMAFWYVAKVNGRADELTVKLSEHVWGDYQSIHSALQQPGHIEKDMEQRVEQVVNDMQRVSVYMSANSRPISFTLLFKRVTWKTVILSVIGFGITLLVGIIKSIATRAAT